MQKQMEKYSLRGNLLTRGLPERISRVNGGYLYSVPPPPLPAMAIKMSSFVVVHFIWQP
jgi:hypothetical protein